MEFILIGLNWDHCLVYLKNVMVLGPSFSEHKKSLQKVLERLD